MSSFGFEQVNAGCEVTSDPKNMFFLFSLKKLQSYRFLPRRDEIINLNYSLFVSLTLLLRLVISGVPSYVLEDQRASHRDALTKGSATACNNVALVVSYKFFAYTLQITFS